MKTLSSTDEWYKLTQQGAQIAATIHPTGVSMRPLIQGGVDSVIVMPLRRDPKKGDIVLFRRADGMDVMHRVWKIEGDTITTFGDGCWNPDAPITRSNILGLAIILKKNGTGKEIKLNTPLRRSLGRAWLALSPLRHAYYYARAIGGKAKRMIFK